MKIALISIVLIALLTSCSKTKQVKIEKISEYTIKTELGELVKDTLKYSFSREYYKSGQLKQVIYLKGFYNSDTLNFEDEKKPTEKKEKNKIFYYRNDTLITVTVIKGDTSFQYIPDDLETPRFFNIWDKKRNILQFGNYWSNELTITENIEFDDHNKPTIQIVTTEFLPAPNTKRYFTELELENKRIQSREKQINEIEYIYY